MHPNPTNRRWSWITVVSGILCLGLASLTLISLERSRRKADDQARIIGELSHVVTALHPLTDRRNLTGEHFQEQIRRLQESTRTLVRLAPADPEVARLARMTGELISALEAQRAGNPISPPMRGWFDQYVKVQSRVTAALPAELLGLRQTAVLGVSACAVGLLLLLATLFDYRRRLQIQRRVEKALRASEEKFRGLFEHVLEGVYQTSRDGKVIAANPALLKMLGLESAEEMQRVDVGRDFYVDPADRVRLTRKLEEHGFLRNEELLLRRRDGVEITVLENARAVRDEAAGVFYYEGSLVDISDRKRAEREAAEYTRKLEEAHQQLEQQARQLLEQSLELAEARDKAIQSSRLKSEFLANLSHEIRAPLTGVAGMAELLLSTELDTRQREFAETAKRSSEHLLSMLNDILDYSRIETGNFHLQDVPFSMRAAIEQVIEHTAGPAEAKGLETTFLVSPEAPDAMRGDVSRLRQVLQALTDNAIKFTDSGEVAVTVSLVRDTPEQALIRFEVEDSGVGIAPENFVRLFEPFYKVDPEGRRRPGGTGLGLAIAKALVERMGGQIGIESEPGQGTLVWFQMRLAKQQNADAWRLETAPLRGKRVLVVDDVASCRGVLATLLTSWGMRVHTAEDPGSALELLQVAAESGDPMHFALIDYDMPGLGGLGLAEAIIDDPATAPTQLVLLAPHSHRSWQDEPVLFGIEAVICKPVRELHLLEVLLACTETASQADLARRNRRLALQNSQFEPQADAAQDRPWILIVEDNEVNQKVTVRLVEKMGCQSEVASNGEEALAAIRRRHYQAILMDCQMPVMDGFETTAAIRLLESGGQRTPIIAMTANAMQGDRELCLSAGMDDYLSKPVSYEDLRATVNKWIGSSAGVQPTAS